MIEAIIEFGNDKIEEIRSIRKQVFNKDLNDEFDKISYHVLVYNNNIPVGTGRLYKNDDVYFIDNICVLKDNQKSYFGDLIVKMLLDKGFNIYDGDILALVPYDLEYFFSKIGFKRRSTSTSNLDRKDYILMYINKAAIIKCSH